jgi:hypothetical protein
MDNLTKDLWAALENIERQDGYPALIRNLFLITSLARDPTAGSWFWHSKYADVVRSIEKTGVQKFNQDDFMREVLRPGGWNRLWQPRTLIWATDRAQELVGDFSRRASEIPIVTSTIPAFNATASSTDKLDFIVVNLPLVIGLVGANIVLLDLIGLHADNTLAFLLPEILWPRKIKKQMREFVKRHHAVMLWLNDPTLPFPFELSQDIVTAGHNLSRIQMLFILLHELAHFKAGHMLLNNDSSVKSSVKYRWPSNWDRELEADGIAMDWLLELRHGSVSYDIKIEAKDAYDILGHALTFLFYSFATLEGLNLLPDQTQFGAHPPALFRWARITQRLPLDQQKYHAHLLGMVGQMT